MDHEAELRSEAHGHRDLVVIGASAGGVETLRRVVADLPSDLDAAVCIVLHVSADSPSLLAGILARSGPLPCRPAQDGDSLIAGRILVAPPNRHLDDPTQCERGRGSSARGSKVKNSIATSL